MLNRYFCFRGTIKMSQYIVSARKYRPQRFDEVIGQRHVASTLKNAITNDQLAHAFLFCGPRGVGKTSCARILAKVLNCQNIQNKVDPCGECSSCTSFNDNASFNIIELDAASNNSVEHIRNLIEQVRFQPQQGTHKVFIIDEVHMLSSQAFNAFLKTLEEPPPYAIFILATTEKHKILPTILSRCQIFDFKRIQIKDTVDQLISIAEKEGIKYEPEALNIIAQKSDGAMRDALSIFDKIVSSSDREITYNEVIENLNILDFDYFFKLTDTFLKQDISGAMLLMDEILRKGFDPELCLQGIAEHFRELLMAKSTATRILITASDSLKERYINQSDLCSHSFLMSGLSILNEADINFQKSKNKRLHAEIALSKINYLHTRINSSPAIVAQKPSEEVQKVITKKENVEKESIQKAAPKVMNKAISASVSVKKNIKSIGFSSEEEILKEIEEENAKKKVRPKVLDEDLILKIWDKYVKDHTSQTVKTSLKNKKFELGVSQISILLPSPNALNTFISEKALAQKLRDAFDIEGLKIEPEISNSAFPEYVKFTAKKTLSAKDKFERLVEKNPSIKSLQKAFNLKVDS